MDSLADSLADDDKGDMIDDVPEIFDAAKEGEIDSTKLSTTTQKYSGEEYDYNDVSIGDLKTSTSTAKQDISTTETLVKNEDGSFSSRPSFGGTASSAILTTTTTVSIKTTTTKSTFPEPTSAEGKIAESII